MTIVKSHRFPVTARWKEGRLTDVTAAGKPDLEVATPPGFKGGVEGVWSPEEMLVGSLASCYAVTFVAIAERVPVTFDVLRVEGVGHVERRADGRVGFVSIEIDVHAEVPATQRPRRGGGVAARERAVHRDPRARCPAAGRGRDRALADAGGGGGLS